MSAFIQAILSGIFFTLVFDFFIYLSIWFYYIQAQEIKEYFNPFFWDNQNIILLTTVALFLSIVFGVFNKIVKNSIIALLLIISLFATVYQPFGFYLGELILKQDYTTFKDSRYTYHGYIIYEGRQEIYFYDTDVNQTFQLNKKDLSL